MESKKTVILATHNQGKYREFVASFSDFPLEFLSLESLKVKLPEETGLTFVENALQKARAIALHSNMPVIADDSGLIVPSLKGQPGIYSARFSGSHATDEKNRDKLLQLLASSSESEREAYFYCVLVYLRHAHDPIPYIAEGLWRGKIIQEPRGTHGFGYDPIFYIPHLNCTAAELALSEKNKISHRGQAVQKLKTGLTEILNVL